MPTSVWQVIAVAVIAISLVGYFAIGRGRAQAPRGRFGPEHDRTVEVPGDGAAARANDRRDEPIPH
jgi:hypothetical protein